MVKMPGKTIGASNVKLLSFAFLAVAALFGASSIGTYNSLVSADAEIEQKAADIDSQLKRRADLVPNLVATVRGYASHEQAIFTEVAQARSRLLGANFSLNPDSAAVASTALNTALGRLLAIAENYPDLKANQNFIRLQDELAGTENRINYARINYNEAVKTYNLKVRRFPGNLLAGFFGFEARSPFTIDESDSQIPAVSFGN